MDKLLSMDKELIKKCRTIINEQIIDFACKEGMTQELLDGIIREELIPIIQKAERERIATVASFTVKLEGNTVVVDAVDWDRLWQALIGDTQ